MTKRIVIINEFASARDHREGIKRIPVHALRAGDVLGTGDRVTQATRDATSDRVNVMLRTNGYPRAVSWSKDALVTIAARDGVGSPEEVAYGEGWHSTENVNPYTSAVERASWERGRAAKKLKFKMNSNSRREGEATPGMKRGVSFTPPKKRIADTERVVRVSRNPTTGGFIVSSPDGKQWKFGQVANAITQARREAERCGCEVKNELTGAKYGPSANDYLSEKGYVAKLIDVKTGATLARSEPHISNGEGLRKWIMTEAQKLIVRGKRVKAEVGVEFFDPQRMNDGFRLPGGKTSKFDIGNRVRRKSMSHGGPVPAGSTTGTIVQQSWSPSGVICEVKLDVKSGQIVREREEDLVSI